MDVTDAELDGIKKEVQKLPTIERNLAKLSQTSDETMKALDAIAIEMAYWRTRSLALTIMEELGQKSPDEEGTSTVAKEEVRVRYLGRTSKRTWK